VTAATAARAAAAAAAAVIVVVVVIVVAAAAATAARARAASSAGTTTERPRHVEYTCACRVKVVEQGGTQVQRAVMTGLCALWALVLDCGCVRLAVGADCNRLSTPRAVVLAGVDGDGVAAVAQILTTRAIEGCGPTKVGDSAFRQPDRHTTHTGAQPVTPLTLDFQSRRRTKLPDPNTTS
jgi:hypothetical protein